MGNSRAFTDVGKAQGWGSVGRQGSLKKCQEGKRHPGTRISFKSERKNGFENEA